MHTSKATLAIVLASALVALCTALAACSSSGGSNTSSRTGPNTSGKTITIGFVTDLTGVASSGFLTSKLGIDAYLNRINAAGGVNGYKIKYILADTNSTPTGALTVDRAGYYRVDVSGNRTSFISRRGGRATVTPANGQASQRQFCRAPAWGRSGTREG